MKRTSRVRCRVAAAALLAAAGAGSVASGAGTADAALRAEHPEVEVSWQRATGAARFVRLPHGAPGDLAAAGSAADPEARAREFLHRHSALFGGLDPERELDLIESRRDAWGRRHLAFAQFHRGVRVFGALLRAHFDAEGRLRTVNGTVVPGVDLAVEPAIPAATGAARALEFVAAELAPPGVTLSHDSPRLLVHQPGLERGLPAAPRLVWRVEVGDGGNVRELVFVDARLGKVIDHLTRIAHERERRAYSGVDQAPFNGIPDSWPDDPDWVEGDPYPTGLAELDGALAATADVYDLFAFLGADSWDGEGGEMDISWNHATGCPNASWNGLLTAFCSGFAVHDVVAHEWGHAYSQTTHGLIYRWQSGALSESYSDLWGEVLDRASTLPGIHDTDAPDLARADGSCSGFLPARLRIVSPLPAAGDLPVGLAAFGSAPAAMPDREIVEARDGVGADPLDACEPIGPGARLAGRIAFANRGGCPYQDKALHVEQAGAVGLIVGNRAESPDPAVAPRMGCDPIFACDPALSIPAVSLALGEADALRGWLDAGPVAGSIRAGENVGAGDSVRWILGEDVRPLGPARDMWTPTCFGHPGRVSDPQYFCSAGDNGGVHFNSGVPNHAFALLVDGGDYNGRSVVPIGRVRAVHLYWRTQTVYQVPTSDFADHADALEAACDDLIGAALPDPWGGPAQTMTASECAQVAEAIAAVELRTEAPCDFTPILAPDPPPACGALSAYRVAGSGFETGADGWSVFRRAIANPSTFDDREWTRVGTLPGGRPGIAFLAPDPRNGDCVTGQAGDDESGVLVLESPDLVLPAGGPARLSFDHYVTTEATWDGGNVKVRSGGGPWRLVPASAFLFNAHNGELREADVNSNPMAGEPAWHGTDEGSNAGSWGTSIVDLAGVVPAETPFRLRFEFGTDRCFGSDLGWWVDDVELSLCAAGDALLLDGFGTGDASRWSSVTP